MSTPSEGSRVVARRYRLRSVLGSGSMGTVWSAYDEFLHRPVAVKEVRLPAGFPDSQAAELRERTLREARAIAVLSHPNVIILHDVARENGEPFVVMELLPSHSLAELLRINKTLTTGQGAAVADAVAAALEAAHAAGITHRDVKPGNVLVASDGRIKLTDFGIARNVSEVTMTRTGMMLGSPAYIAPEVASGGAVSPAADLWGLGATLFSTVEGQPPYDADGDPLETVGRVVHGAVPQPTEGPLAPVISGLMAKEPGERMSLAEVRARLHPLLTAQPRHLLFGPELFEPLPTKSRSARADVDVTEVISAVASDSEWVTAPEPTPSEPAHSNGAELAADPGPLPFHTGPRSRIDDKESNTAPSRGPLTGTLLTIISVVLFLIATAGGFVVTRTLAGQSLAPPSGSERDTSTPAQQALQPLAPQHGDATNLKGEKGGLFSVQVPKDWTKFDTQQQESGKLPGSTLVQFVSPNGTQTLNIERFGAFYETGTEETYWDAVEQRWPQGDFKPVASEPLNTDKGTTLTTYRTTEHAPNTRDSETPSDASVLTRTTFAETLRVDSSMWVVSVTVPTEQEGTGRAQLFDRMASTFQTTG